MSRMGMRGNVWSPDRLELVTSNQINILDRLVSEVTPSILGTKSVLALSNCQISVHLSSNGTALNP